jgi:hypothetical protein
MEALQSGSLKTKTYPNILYFTSIFFVIAEICCFTMIVGIFLASIGVAQYAPFMLLSAPRDVLVFRGVVRVVENPALFSPCRKVYDAAGWSELEHRVRAVVTIWRIAWASFELCRVRCGLR